MSPEILLDYSSDTEDEDNTWLWEVVGGSNEDIMDRGREAKIVLGMRAEAITTITQGEMLISNSNELRTASINKVQAQLFKKRRKASQASSTTTTTMTTMTTMTTTIAKSNRKSYKSLPMENGSVKFPVILGRGFHRITLLSIGEIRECFKGDGFYFPIGYKCKRKFYSFDSVLEESKSKKEHYYCEIALLDLKPLFKITSDTYEDSDSDINILWDRFLSKFSSPIKDILLSEFRRVESWFGFEHDSLLLHFKENVQQ